ncbi:MFS transporter [Kitasatospora sp. NPDC048407]|uniref:MFS transporter n=1 Tax=Kitasatospora sp. NPDC048407 TaxID=3364051 RepID=UPI003719F04B
MSTAADPSATGTETPRPAPTSSATVTAAGPPSVVRNGGAVLLAVGVAAAAVNLRPVVTSLGALLDPVREGLGMSATVAGLLAAVPPLCFALLGFAAPGLARRLGPITVVTAAMGAIAAGVLARSFTGSTAVFLLLTALALAGVALANVLLPVVIKRYFPDRVGPMIGLYSMALSVGTSLAAATTVPLAHALGGSWRLGLGVWALPAVLALALWLVVLFVRRDKGTAVAPAAQAHTRLPILRSGTAWALGAFFGLQSTSAYSTMGFLPKIYHDAGVSESAAGVLLAVVMAISVPVSFVLPNLAARGGDQRMYVVVLGLCGIAGYLGLMLAAGTVPWLWAILVGLSMCAFPLALTMLGLRARTPGGVAQLSAFAQSLGYLICIPGPILMGALYENTGEWYLPLGLLALLLVPQILVGVRAARARHIEDEVVG